MLGIPARDGRPPDPSTEQAACQGAAPRGREDQRVGLRADEGREVLLKSTYHRPRHRTVRLEREVFGS